MASNGGERGGVRIHQGFFFWLVQTPILDGPLTDFKHYSLESYLICIMMFNFIQSS